MIYDQFFGFREEPFGVTPDPKFLYLSKKHEDALAHLNFGLSENRGFVMLTGEVGSGKTTLIRYLLDNLGADKHTSLIINPMFDPFELLKLINHDFGVVCTGNTQKDHLDALNNFLLEGFSKNEKAVLVIDEAQELSLECLEFIRLLSNLETHTKKLFQVILVGQPELKRLVESEPLSQLNQRIAVRYHLGPLDLDDTIIYINHRLKIAGGGMITFPVKGIKVIYRHSRGIPRLINLACDRALLMAYSEGKVKIDAKMVRQSIRDLGFLPQRERTRLLVPLTAGILLSLFIIILAYSTLSKEENYLEKVGNMLRGIKTVGDFFISDGIYMVSKPELSEAACFLNLLNTWGEKNLKTDGDLKKDIEMRGYSLYRAGANLDSAIRLNLPCILNLRHNNQTKLVVLRWVVGKDVMLIDPVEGKNILHLSAFKSSVTDITLIYKNRYNSKDKIQMVQKRLKELGMYNQQITGKLSAATKKALMRFQQRKGIAVTGGLNDETAIILSNDKGTPHLIPE
ncbi:MAG: AAA family ATPase [Nitrospirae bacterium]|nr:AAA family ATPase [Nitrospirota bacterium]